MNNSINYSGYVDMVLDSSDDFEPYGYAVTPNTAGDGRGVSEANYMLHRESLIDEPWGD